ncbi:hypothetical protein Q4485_06990 [Granulosicoccaceae sp. 1_MG-2023]|nr:hypothetical protein [Granulosicoccaceae sp. 1_MG-2023]
MKINLKAVVAGLALAAGTAHAGNEGLFWGINIGEADVTSEKLGVDTTASGFALQVGHQYNKWLGVEGWLGVYSDEFDSLVRDPLVKQYGLLGRLGWAWEQVSLYGLIGYTNTLHAIENVEDNQDGLATGLELNLFGTPSTALSFSILNQDRDKDFKTINLGIIHYFGGQNDGYQYRTTTTQ